jgi:4-amino-4-deoxy-L-arabinose transferase-like glycosyltransferase
MLNVRTQWPWISTLVGAIAVLNPLGLDVIYAAFFSNEALSRNIWGSIALTGMAVMALIVLLEWRIRVLILKRRARRTTTTRI